jgi:hypothetical protein
MKSSIRYAKAGPVGEARMTAPSPEQLARINYLSRRKLAGDEVYVGFVDLANDRVDRTYERFPVEILKQFAATAPGCSVLMGHDYSGPPVGLFFDAKVVKLNDVNWLRCWYYMPKTAENEHVRSMIDGGVYRYASIGFGAADGGGKLDLVCDLCGGSLFGRSGCEHWPGEEYAIGKQSARAVFHYDGQARMVEGSIVYLGAQYDAEMKGLGMESNMADRLAQDMAISHAAAFTKSFEGVVIPRRKVTGPPEKPAAGEGAGGGAPEDEGEAQEAPAISPKNADKVQQAVDLLKELIGADSGEDKGEAESEDDPNANAALQKVVDLLEEVLASVEPADGTPANGSGQGGSGNGSDQSAPAKVLSAKADRAIAELVDYHVRKNLENLRSRLAGMMAEVGE